MYTFEAYIKFLQKNTSRHNKVVNKLCVLGHR